MFLPVFVHPGKRGPSPVKKSPEKSTAKGGPPAPPSTTSSALPGLLSLASHPAPCSPATAPTTPGQSNACLSLHSLVARKKISTSSRPPARPLAGVHPRPPGRFFSTHVRESIAPAYTRTHARTYAHAHTRHHVHPRAHVLAEETYARAV